MPQNKILLRRWHTGAFDGLARAIRCRAKIIAATQKLRMPARVSVRTGEVEGRDDLRQDIAIHITAQEASLADADELLVSRTVRAPGVGAGFEFETLSTQPLKGNPGDWGFFILMLGS